MAHTYGNCLYHFVFSTRNRENIIRREWMDRLWDYMGGIAKNHGMTALTIGGTENHIHLLMMTPPAIAPARGIQIVKGLASKWIHEEIPGNPGFAWQEGYGVFTVGFRQIDKTRDYIANQEEHHRKRTFEEEFREFLLLHKVEFNEEYMWG